MKKFVFKYRRWYLRLIIMANLLIPVFTFVSLGKHVKFIDTPIAKDIQAGLLVSAIAALVFVIFGLVYIFQTLKTERLIRGYTPIDKQYYKRLYLGILFYTISMTIMLMAVTVKFFPKIQKWSWLNYFIYVLSGITFFFGIFSNINIHQFEAANYFRIFYYRHKDEDVKEIMEGLNPPRYRKTMPNIDK